MGYEARHAAVRCRRCLGTDGGLPEIGSMATHDPHAKERIEAYEQMGRQVGQAVGKRLGTDSRGRHIDFFPSKGIIKIREEDGLNHVVTDIIDLDGSSVRTYCTWVESQVDAVDVDWTEAAPSEVRQA